MEQKWRTSIGYAEGEKTVIRGYDLNELLKKHSFTEVVFLTWAGRLPSRGEDGVFSALLSSGVDHGINPPSVTAARIAYSGSGSYLQGLAAGLLAMGKYHGAAGEGAARVFQENIGKRSAKDVVADFVKRGERIPGFGHKMYKEEDPRVTRLVDIARRHEVSLEHTLFAYEIQKELEKQTGKKLPLNIDGGTSSLLSDLGLHWRYCSAVFVLARAFGVTSHLVEEAEKEKPFRRLEDDEVEYTGQKIH